jgi:5-methylcytosine-specific restriction enzyme A
MLTAEEFLRFSRAAQGYDWKTKTGKHFSIEVRKNGIGIIPESTTPREISNAEIVKFCRLYSESCSLNTSHYSELFNKSYLIAIVSKYDSTLGEIEAPEEASLELLLKEGATKQVHVNAYERNATARVKCIEIYGTSCFVCGFNFEERYGFYAAGFIHIHHLNPLSETSGERIVDPINDLRPVCPNCHAVIHLRGGCLTISEVSKLLKNAI